MKGAPMRTKIVVGMVAFSLVLTLPARAQEEKNPHKDTHWFWSANVTPAQMRQMADNSGFRIIDLAVARQSPLEFTVVWVDNHGPFAREWWWYYNVTGPQILELQKKHGAHVLDVEVMTIKPDAKFAVVLVKDPGSNADYGWTAGPIPGPKSDS